MVVVLAKIGSPSLLGQFAISLAISSPIIMLTNLQLRAIQATDAKTEFEFSHYFGLRIITTALAIGMIIAIVLSIGYRRETALTAITLAIAKGSESVSDIFYGLFQKHERMDRIAKSLMMRGSLSLVVLGLAIYVTGSALWGAAGLVVSWTFTLMMYDVQNGWMINPVARGIQNPSGFSKKRRLALPMPTWDSVILKKLAALALPLGFVMTLISLNANIPQYFIERYLGERELGIYAAMAYIGLAGNTAIGALGQSVSPMLGRYYAGGDAVKFRGLLVRLVAAGALAGGGAILLAMIAGREILNALYRAEYSEYSDVFTWIMLSSGVGYVSSFLGYGMTAARCFRVQVPLFAIVAAVTAGMCALLVPSGGILGAAKASVVAAAVNLLGGLGVNTWAVCGISKAASEGR